MPTLCPLPHHHDEPTGHQLGVCPAHYRRLRNTISAVARDYALIATMLEPGSAGNDEQAWKSRRVDPPAPARLDALVLRDPRTKPDGHRQPIPRIVRDYADQTCDGRNLTRVHTFTAWINILTVHTAWITMQPWITEFAANVEACAKALAHDLGDTPRSGTVAHCPLVIGGTVCGGRIRALTYSLGVHCDRCSAQWVGDLELHRLRSMLDKDLESSA